MLSSKCRDLFYFDTNSALVHVATGKYIYKEQSRLLLHQNNYSPFFIKGDAIVSQFSKIEHECIQNTDNGLEVTALVDISMKCPAENEITILPGK